MVRSTRDGSETERHGARPERGDDAPHPVDIHVGQRLRLRRSILGITQTQLAEAVAMSFQSIQKYERGENRISASRLYEFAQVLRIRVGYFYEGLPADPDGDPGFEIDEPIDLSKQELHDLVRTFAGIDSKRLRRRFLQLLREVVELTGADAPPKRALPLAEAPAHRPDEPSADAAD
jgi:transcriptional regulator with XRE-family HTH domain